MEHFHRGPGIYEEIWVDFSVIHFNMYGFKSRIASGIILPLLYIPIAANTHLL